MKWPDDYLIPGTEPYHVEEAGIIYCGDCRDILPKLPKMDLAISDPPYGIKENAHRVKSRGKLAKTTDYGDFDWDKKPASKEEIELIRAAAPLSIIWGGNYFHLPPSRAYLVWDKLNSGNFADCELAWTNFKMSVRIFRFRWNGMIRDGEARGVPRVHPAQKPLELMKWCLSFAPAAQIIIDSYLGSGTTALAAKELGRKFIGIEISREYADIAVKRLRQGVLNFG